jgi:maleylpyruvate isomerase
LGYVAAVTVDPLGLAVDVQEATDRLLTTAEQIPDPTAPSLLPGWTRGHVLTHIARNADGAVNLLTWARTGVETPQYSSWESRVADIEAGSSRPLPDLVADLRAACSRLATALETMPAEAWAHIVHGTRGRDVPAAGVVWSRLKEVEVHHVDLGAGYTPADWPEAFTLRMLRTLASDFTERDDGPRFVLRVPEIGHDIRFGDGVSSPVVSGSAAAAVGWLIGRSTGEELTVEPPGSLPPVPVWS